MRVKQGVRNMVTEKIQTKDVMVWTRKFTLECVLSERKFVFWFFDIHENLHLGFRFWTKKLFCSDLRKKIIWFWLWKVLFFSFVNFMNILWILWISWISEFHEFHEFREVMNFWISRILWISRLFEKSLKMLYLNFYAEMKLFNAA